MEGCLNYFSIHYAWLSCEANQFGTYCDGLEYRQLRSPFTEGSQSCRNTSTCDPRCVETLNNITNTIGCCFNVEYNTAGSAMESWLSDEFWSMCNLKPLGRCRRRYADDELIPTTTTGSTSGSGLIPIICSALLLLAIIIAVVVFILCAVKIYKKRSGKVICM